MRKDFVANSLFNQLFAQEILKIISIARKMLPNLLQANLDQVLMLPTKKSVQQSYKGLSAPQLLKAACTIMLSS